MYGKICASGVKRLKISKSSSEECRLHRPCRHWWLKVRCPSDVTIPTRPGVAIGKAGAKREDARDVLEQTFCISKHNLR